MKVAFLGLGQMGSRMASRLLDSGLVELTVYNRTASRADALLGAGAKVASSPREAVIGAELIISMVTDDEAARALWLTPHDGALYSVTQGALVLESTTCSPGWITQLHGALATRGAALIDAPVLGSTPQAQAGALVFLLGASEAELEPLSPLLLSMGAKLIPAGKRGQGATLKLMVNALFAAQVALMSELLHTGDALGLEPEHQLALLSPLPVLSAAALNAARLMVAHDHQPRFPIDLVAKDLRYALALGGSDHAMPMIAATLERFEQAQRQGRGELNISAV